MSNEFFRSSQEGASFADIQAIEAARRKYEGVVLEDEQIVDLLINRNPDDIETKVLFYGRYHKNMDIRPVVHFPEIIFRFFDDLSVEEKENFLKNSFRLVSGNVRRRFPVKKTKIAGRIEWNDIGGKPPVDVIQTGLVEILTKTLEFTRGDVQRARRLLKQTRLRTHHRFEGGLLYSVYYFEHLDEASKSISPYKAYVEESPKVAQLAFWLEVDLGCLNPQSANFDQLINHFSKARGAVKVEVIKYMAELLLADAIKGKRLKDVELLLVDNQEIYQTVKQRSPEAAFVKAFDLARFGIAVERLKRKVMDERMEISDLIEMLESTPALLNYVSLEDLEYALVMTKDHGLALRISRIINKKKPIESTY